MRLVLAEQERSTTLHHALTEALDAAGDEMPAIRMAVGPEGGWTPEEEALFDAENWKPVSLGPRILRAETAAISAMAVAAALMSKTESRDRLRSRGWSGAHWRLESDFKPELQAERSAFNSDSLSSPRRTSPSPSREGCAAVGVFSTVIVSPSCRSSSFCALFSLVGRADDDLGDEVAAAVLVQVRNALAANAKFLRRSACPPGILSFASPSSV